MVSILNGEQKEKKPSGKSVKLDSDIYEKYFSNTDKKQISSIVEQALDMYFNQFKDWLKTNIVIKLSVFYF